MTKDLSCQESHVNLPGVPCHIIQRGNNREAAFFAEQVYQFYLECLSDALNKYHVEIPAYVLMTNHVHLLMTPLAKESISLVMQSVGRRYVQYVNLEYRRTGSYGRVVIRQVLLMQKTICFRVVDILR